MMKIVKNKKKRYIIVSSPLLLVCTCTTLTTICSSTPSLLLHGCDNKGDKNVLLEGKKLTHHHQEDLDCNVNVSLVGIIGGRMQANE